LALALLLAIPPEPTAAEPGATDDANRVRRRPPREVALGVADVGIYPDLDPRVQIDLPRGLDRAALALIVSSRHRLAVLYLRDHPLKVYPLGGPAELAVGGQRLGLRAGDRDELAALGELPVRVLAERAAPPPGDRDDDGVPDPLDVYLGGIKNALNAAPYIGGYRSLPSPGGDVPRTEGVCTDVVVRAARNAGLDLQLEVARDIRRARTAYPMVKKPNASIDHRRVKTVLPYFVRHWTAHAVRVGDAADPYQPGDVVFMDTFPNKPGPDHIGVVSGRLSAAGVPLVINAWTDGFVAQEMDLLPSIPVTHRFRIPSAP
jgi:uncharacterized protein YijF (DUF1287 family)